MSYLKPHRMLCNHKQIIVKKQLFKNKTIHIYFYCKNCKKREYLPRTKENLKLTDGWIKENDETDIIDRLHGWDKKEPQELKKSCAREKIFYCGLCEDVCIVEKCDCPCHWPDFG